MTKLSDLGPPVLGKRHGARGNGPDNFYSCATCGQKVDMRDFRQVMWHEQQNHEALEPEDSAQIINFPKRPK
ncbi:hypothetical protein LB577_33030 [Mesorhizobium sp. B283B1A]|uniref:hypothetical protein n=1 Tax=Mesorhizobium TaxID=68287 RepID=UPI00041486F1|nr:MULTISPECIES: hypothetical protein [Mesorhizobium]MCA0051728.1 hypothetical protein [Mesorhizobium sp. B283B1A]UQS62731.1 hypothetical protein M5D98_21550 [Mesorhizobium opportunistum]